MDIELLRTFLEVDRLRHFRKAADELCISHGAVSTRINSLEAQLDLVMVSTDPGADLVQAMGQGYITIDRGLSVALQHRRLYPDARKASLRIASAALGFLLEFGGAGNSK